jgi:serine protease inhibitor ecotin
MKTLLLAAVLAALASAAVAVPMPISCPYPQKAVWSGVQWICIYPR